MDNTVKKEVEMNNIGDVMKGGISAILLAVGYVVLWCGTLCLIMSATGSTDDQTDIGWCGAMCLFAAAILMGSGFTFYKIVKPKV